MGLFGGGKSKKAAAPVKKGTKKGAANNNDAKLSAVPEEPSVDLVAPEEPVTQLSSDKESAYTGFKSTTHSEYAAAERAKATNDGRIGDLPQYDFEVGKVYSDANGSYRYDEYGQRHSTDEVPSAPEIPDRFFGYQDDTSSAEAYPAYESPDDDEQIEYVSEYTQPDSHGVPAYNTPQPSTNHSPKQFSHADGIDTVNIHNAPNYPDPYSAPAAAINHAIDSGAALQGDFPTIDVTIASLANSTKSPDEITNIMLGYLATTIAGEGLNSAVHLLGPDNLYTPLLISAINNNLKSNPIQPVALKELWDIQPEIREVEKIVYKERPGTRYDEDKNGYWITIDESAPEAHSIIFEALSVEHTRENNKKNLERFDYSVLNY